MSAAARRAIIAATKKRWAAVRAAKAAAAPAPVAVAPKTTPAKAPEPVKKGGLTAAGRKALSHRDEETVGGEKEGGGEGESGLIGGGASVSSPRLKSATFQILAAISSIFLIFPSANVNH
jgi:hypothetical protein